MCLLDEVLAWDADRISCRSMTHRLPDNPLRARGRLGIACGIEYAAQAMAIHGALSASRPGATARERPAAAVPTAGYLAGVRSVRAYLSHLDGVMGALICEAVRVAGDEATALYEFTLQSAGMPLLTGRASVMFSAGERPRS
jgi:predicted hotdog family 3-hydroxylacyl-ACP dehydratase